MVLCAKDTEQSKTVRKTRLSVFIEKIVAKPKREVKEEKERRK